MCKFARLYARVRVRVRVRGHREHAVTCMHVFGASFCAMCEAVYVMQ